MTAYEVYVRTSGRRKERQPFCVHGPNIEQARRTAAFILSAPAELVHLEVAR